MTILIVCDKKNAGVFHLYYKTTIRSAVYVEGRLNIKFGDRTGVSILPAEKNDEKVFAPGTVVVYQIEALPSRIVIGMIKVETDGIYGKEIAQGGEFRKYWRIPPIEMAFATLKPNAI